MFARAGGVGIHERAELLTKGGHVRDGGFEVEIEAIDDGSAEGTGRGGAGGVGTED